MLKYVKIICIFITTMGKNLIILFLTFLTVIVYCQSHCNASKSVISINTEELIDNSCMIEEEGTEDDCIYNIVDLFYVSLKDDISRVFFSGSVLGIPLSVWQPPEKLI